MKNVSALCVQPVLDARGALSMGKGQVDDKLPAQVIDLARADVDVLSRQFLADLPAVTVTQKQGLAHVDQDVIAEVAARGHEATKLRGTISMLTMTTARDRFLGVEQADMQRDHITGLGFEYFERSLAIRTVVLVGTKNDRRRQRKQAGTRQSGQELVEVMGKTGYEGEGRVFFICRP